MTVIVCNVAPHVTMNTSEKRINFIAEVSKHMKCQKITPSTPPPSYEVKGGGYLQRESDARRKQEMEIAAKHRETIFVGGGESDDFVVADEGELI
jgi:hypothetical protein